jgi:CRP/FNR family transcriptional regulator, anaerobic regulatory protein
MLTGLQRARFLENIAGRGTPPAISGAEWKELESLLRPLRLAAGEHFIRPGEPAVRFGLILSGLLRFYYLDRDGRQATKAFRGAGEVAAPYAELLLGVASRSSIDALEDSELLVADYARFDALSRRRPCWQAVARLMAEHHYLAKERREYEFLQTSAEDRYLAFRRERPDLLERLPQYQIASYLGVTPVALSRIRGRMHNRRKE